MQACVLCDWCLLAGGNVSTIVRHVQVPVISNPLCNKYYTKISNMVKLHISEDMMCAGVDEGGKDACQVCIF